MRHGERPSDSYVICECIHTQAFDRHCNMVLENVKEMWTETPRDEVGNRKGAPINKDRYISKMFFRGDSVIIVLRNPV